MRIYNRLLLLLLSLVLGFGAMQVQAAQSSSSADLPALGGMDHKAGDNICPVCGKSRTECNDLYLKSLKDPSLKPKVCAIHKPDFITGKTRPFNCPVCGHKVNIPIEQQHYEHADTDLCPHPKGKIRFISEIVVCPNCGYAAFTDDFVKYIPPENIKAFVKASITPGMAKGLRVRLAPEAKINHKELMKLFEHQNDIPDTLRCMNAYSIYLERSKINKDVEPLKLAHVAWMAAWAFRREVNAPVESGPLMNSLRRISSIVQKDGLSDDDMARNITLLSKLYADTERFDIVERLIICIYQAGYYNRLGLNQWALQALVQVKNESEKKYITAEADPWLKAKAFDGVPGPKRKEVIDASRKFMLGLANQRMNALQMENRFLGYAAEILQQAMVSGKCESIDIPSYVYLVGEFERRRENHHKALLWLEGVKQMLGVKVGVEHYAPQQIALLRRYVKDRNITPKPDKNAQKDWGVLQQLAVRAKAAQKERDAKEAAATAAQPAPVGK